MLDVVEKHVAMWKKSRLSPLLRELAVSVVRRAAQGMDDRLIWMYLDHRMRGLDPESAEWKAVYNTKMALLRADSRLSQDVRRIREELARIELERQASGDTVPPLARQEALARQETIENWAMWAWRDELRYKNSLIPPGARGGGRSGRRRRRKVKGGKIDTTPLEVVIQKHNERLLRKRA